MAEVDELISHTLRGIGCPIEEAIQSVSTFTPELLVECVARCLRKIKGHTGFPLKLPALQGARFRICTLYAEAFRELGYREEIGFQQLLYPNEKETRRILLFLIEHLPKEEAEEPEEALGAEAILSRRIFQALDSWKKQAGEDVPKLIPRLPFTTRMRLCSENNKRAVVEPWRLYLGGPMTPVLHPLRPRVLASSALDCTDGHAAAARVLEEELSSTDAVASGTTALSKEKRKAALKSIVQSAIASSQKLPLNATLSEVVHGGGLGAAGAGVSGKTGTGEGGAGGAGTGASAEGDGTEGGKSAFTRKAMFTQEVAEPGTGVFVAGMAATMAAVAAAGTTGTLSPEEAKKKEEEARAKAKADAEAAAAEKLAAEEKEKLEKRAAAEKEAEERQAEAEAAAAKLSTMKKKAEAATVEIAAFKAEIEALVERAPAKEEEVVEIEKQVVVKSKVVGMLSDVSGNMKQLTAIVAQTEGRLAELEKEWDAYRKPLEDELRRKKNKIYARREEAKEKLDKAKSMRQECKQLQQDMKTKEQQYQHLQEEMSKMKKDINRASYVRRIMDIMKNINKQKKEIKRILSDIRDLQKRINNQSEALHRSYAATDEIIFTKAKTDAGVKPMYRLLVDLHQAFEDCAKAVEDSGRTMNDIQLLEKQTSDLEARISSKNEQQMRADLKQIKKENVQLKARLEGM